MALAEDSGELPERYARAQNSRPKLTDLSDGLVRTFAPNVAQRRWRKAAMMTIAAGRLGGAGVTSEASVRISEQATVQDPMELMDQALEDLDTAVFMGKGDRALVKGMLLDLEWNIKMALANAEDAMHYGTALTIDPTRTRTRTRVSVEQVPQPQRDSAAAVEEAAATPLPPTTPREAEEVAAEEAAECSMLSA